MLFAKARNVHFPEEKFRSLAAYDGRSDIQDVVIDLPSFQERMLAIVFVKTKMLQFTQPTYFGVGDPALAGGMSPVVTNLH